MLYKNYIENFTVSDETKSALLNTVLQLASEPQAVRATNRETVAVTGNHTPTNKPSRKRVKPWVVALICVVVVAIVATSMLYGLLPWRITKSIVLDYMTNLMVDVDGVTAFGIKREKTTNVKKANAYSADDGFSDFLSFGDYAYAAEPEYKNYLYKTTETYEPGNVEYSDGTITRVTFKKNSTKTEDVYDENGNLITSGTELTQDEISGQINKVYVGKNFTFMSFSIPVEKSGSYRCEGMGNGYSYEYVSVRPDSLIYDEYGYSDFDKVEYFSRHLVQSFVIDNNTGYIYKIEGLAISEIISDDVVVAIEEDPNDIYQHQETPRGGSYYRMSVNEDGTLSFTDVVPNETLNGDYRSFIDKNGWLYLHTGFTDVDEQNKVVFFADYDKYLISSDKRVFTWSYDDGMKIDCEVIDGVETPVPDDLTVFNLSRWNAAIDIWGYYKGRVMWNGGSNNAASSLRIDGCVSFADDTGELHWYDETTVISLKDNQVKYITLDVDACLENPRLNIPLNEFTVVEADEGMSAGSWQYADSTSIYVGNDQMVVQNVYYKITATASVYYQLVKVDGKLQLNKLSDKTYTANTFILQPINK